MDFKPEQLIKARTALGINKSEAARRLNMSAMGYGRYENGNRTPSFQTLSFIAQKFNTTIDFLCGEDNSLPNSILITKEDDPELFQLIAIAKNSNKQTIIRLLEYAQKI